MRNLAIIPARGGSKRIPRKNIKDFLGKPIIAYSIETALKSGLFNEIMVSTDDDEIAEVAIKFGATVPFFRSKETSDDFSTLAEVVDEVTNEYNTKVINIDHVCCILPTAVFINADLLNEGYQMLVQNKFDSIRPIVEFDYPIQRAFYLNDDSSVGFFNKEYASTRSQDLDTFYHDSGLFYWLKSDKKFGSENKGGFPINKQFCQDIDTEEDWSIAELKYKILNLLANEG